MVVRGDCNGCLRYDGCCGGDEFGAFVRGGDVGFDDSGDLMIVMIWCFGGIMVMAALMVVVIVVFSDGYSNSGGGGGDVDDDND